MRTFVARLVRGKAAIAAAVLFAAAASFQASAAMADTSSATAPAATQPDNATPAATASAPAAASSQPTTSAPATEPVANPPLSSGSVSVPVPSAGKSAGPNGGTKKSIHKKSVKKRHAIVKAAAYIGQVNASEVNVRSGPKLAYYPVGQLKRGQLVKVVGTVNSWDRIAAPAGTRCYISRQFVHLSADGSTGHVSADYVYLRAASPLTPASHYAVVGLVRRGTHVSITGATKNFYVIRPPHGTDFYVSGQFIMPAPADATYITPQISMPAGFKGPGLPGTSPAPEGTALSGAGNSAALNTPAANSGPTPAEGSGGGGQVVPIPTTGSNSAKIGGNTPESGPALAGGGGVIPVIPGVGKAPSANSATTTVGNPVKLNTNAYAAFSRLNRKTQREFRKPVLHRNLTPLLADYRKLAAEPNLPPSVKQGTAEWIKEIKNGIKVQELAKAAANTPAISNVIAPYQQKWEKSQNLVNSAITHAPYLAKGILKTSDAIHDYALVDPVTGRVVAYLKPASKIDIAKLLGSYIGVKGVVDGKTGVVIRLIDVYTATMLPMPRPANQTPAGSPQVP